ncbi:undecaprenyldiphospho-muramoylpentapeptide beta-N-acetylglucosaminyltransferase [Pollutimonas nitritireducens]|uniref:UDP-N-acetylglucosamine--N-acetylmuramyl-(pentapeptide) pyrophosphoryl-undecaprenol N-acetylglucosamine transferase n=1 Tax=Pollutimonas nitritireducens TaxID=2045209 RepID=A0A2N4UKC6_9BURK|nr:undecaprenyldiphospho-muramoylpentapeptide beta-N-acetylglucosaminyltransferase [Pollutimonas nitritireducens]PLC55438.1 undecaprenyldiphospho-muramoylpentapeptide beta-N-acetylglucosaminyltransferase [Pollutimonas nitritireducens]
MSTTRTLLIMAGGTGGHIMPGLAVAHEMQARGWTVCWLGNPERMEGKLVPAQGIELIPLRFAGLRGKGLSTLLKLPLSLLRACMQARKALSRVKPDVVLGMGGYVAFPGGLMAALQRTPVVIHEQNAIAGTANRWLARMASKVLVGFPGALPGAVMVGNPVRQALTQVAPVEQRYAQRQGPIRVLVVGGSLGAAALNTAIPQALSRLPEHERPIVTHQAGQQHVDTLRHAYQDLGVQATCHAFIDDMAGALAEADVVICRAGAMAVAEVAVVGVAALFVPLPQAIDDHQTANARYLSDCQGGWLQKQSELTPEWLAQWLRGLNRAQLADVARHAHEHACLNATQLIADACEQLVGRRA